MKRTPMTRKTPLKRSALSRGKGPSLRRTPLRKVNTARVARKRKVYATHLRSAYWLQLRYERFMLDRGMCQCEWCIEERKNDPTGVIRDVFAAADRPANVTRMEAHVPIPVHFTAKGTAPWRRIRGFSTHHVRYRTLGEEQLKDLRTMYVHHHEATEAKYSTRWRYLGITK